MLEHAPLACIHVCIPHVYGPCSVSQHAGLAAVTQVDKAWFAAATAGYREKRDYTLRRLRAMPGVAHAYEPQGAFYAFPSVKGCLGKRTPQGKLLEGAEDVCLYLLEQCLLAVVPGEAFGDGECLRISYAESLEVIKDAMDRMETGLQALR